MTWKWPRKGSRGVLAALRLSAPCRRNASLGSARDVIGWWEARRIPFNLLVGTAGVVTCLVTGVVALESEMVLQTEFGWPDPPLFALIGVLLYGIFANIFFTGGWVAELIVRSVWPQEADRFATLSLALGVIFSVVLTLAPGILIGAAGVFQLLAHAIRTTHR
jgi:hypothetical protein